MSQAESAISAYQRAAVLLAKDRGLDGIICSHLHYPLVEQFDVITYCNDGDWVENCTALVEDYAGEFHLVNGFDMALTSIVQLYPRAAQQPQQLLSKVFLLRTAFDVGWLKASS